MHADPSCVFCKIVSGKLPSHKIYEDPNYLVFLDIHPSAPGHALVIPKNHSTNILHATPHDRKGLLEVVAEITPSILQAVDATAFNIYINTGKDAGQIVFHTHVHIIPRQGAQKAKKVVTKHAKSKKEKPTKKSPKKKRRK